MRKCTVVRTAAQQHHARFQANTSVLREGIWNSISRDASNHTVSNNISINRQGTTTARIAGALTLSAHAYEQGVHVGIVEHLALIPLAVEIMFIRKIDQSKTGRRLSKGKWFTKGKAGAYRRPAGWKRTYAGLYTQINCCSDVYQEKETTTLT